MKDNPNGPPNATGSSRAKIVPFSPKAAPRRSNGAATEPKANGHDPQAAALDAITTLRVQLHNLGYVPLPDRGKIPAIKGWNAKDYTIREISPPKAKGDVAKRLLTWLERFPGAHTTGVRIENGLLVIDIDVDDESMIEKLFAALQRIAPDVWDRAPTRYGGGSWKLALFCQIEGEDFIRLGTRKYRRPNDPETIYHHLEAFGGRPFSSGKCSRQFAIAGPRSYADDGTVETEYSWAKGVPKLHEIAAAELPAITKKQVLELLDVFEAEAKAAGWVVIEDADEGDGESADVYDIDRETTRFDVYQAEQQVSYADIESMFFTRPEVRVSPLFSPSVTSTDRPDRCTVFWSRRFDCLVIKDWKDSARHYPKQFAPPDMADLGARLEQAAERFGHPIPAGTEMRDDAPPPDIIDGENEDDAQAPSRLADIPLPDGVDWTRPDGVLGEIVDFTLGTSQQPNRPMAVAAAITTLSAVCGRWLYSPTGAALGVYIVCLADTGVGKDTPLSIPERVLRAAGLERLHTTGKAFSISALEQMMVKRPCCLATVDEIGTALFGRMSHKGANANEQDMRNLLLEMWSRNQFKGPFGLTKRAQQLEKLKHPIPDAIVRPSLTLFGVSAAKRFWENIAPGSIQDGFLNRFLIIIADPRGEWQDVAEADNQVPQTIADALRKLVPATAGPLAGVISIYDIVATPETLDAAVHRLRWQNDEVGARSHTFQKQITGIIKHNPEEKDLVSRVFEYAIRLASLHAVSRAGREARVTRRDLDWGIALSLHAGRNLIVSAGRHMAENEHESRLNRVRNLIMDAGKITRSELLRQIRSMNARDLNDAIAHLIGAGWVRRVMIRTKGRAAEGWKWL